MRLPSVLQVLSILFLLSAKGKTSPIPWPEEKLEAINYLRAKGASEEEIAALFPRPLIAPGPPSMHISHYPTIHSIEPVGIVSGLEAATSKDYQSKQRRLTQIVGRRDEDLRKGAQQRHEKIHVDSRSHR